MNEREKEEWEGEQRRTGEIISEKKEKDQEMWGDVSCGKEAIEGRNEGRSDSRR